MNCCAGGGIIRSSVATRYQLGFVLHEACHFRIVASSGDHHATIRVTDDHHLARLRRDDAPRHDDVILHRNRRVLHDDDLTTVAFENAVHALPARAVHESSVNQNNAGRCL